MSYNGKHQFTHTTSRRRASVVYGSMGKAGLFLPEDFVEPKKNTSIETGDNGANESTSLIEPAVSKGSTRRYSREILEDERQLLESNHIPYGGTDEGIVENFEHAIIDKRITSSKLAELKWLMKSSIPLVATFLLEISFPTVSVFAVGHIGPTELAAVSIGAMTVNMTGYATIQGLATALDTLCPQAFGAGKYKLVGSYFQKCTALISVVMIPIIIAWIFFGTSIIMFLVPEEETARLSAVYLKFIAPGIPAYILFETGKRFLQAQGVYHISTYVLLVTAPLNAVMTLLFVKHIGYLGAPIAVSINFWIMAFGLLVCTIYFVKPESTPANIHPMECWNGLNIEDAFSSWGKLITLAIPGLVMLEAEFLAFEILTLLAAYLGTLEVAAQSIGTNVASMMYQIPFAISIAASTRIANYLGAGLADSARKATQAALGFGICVAFMDFFILFIFRSQIAHLYTNDENVLKIVDKVMWLIASMQVCDTMNAVSAGCLRGQGQTKIGGIVNFLSYYVVGVPLALYLAFYSPIKGSLDGLWIGCWSALTIIAVTQSYYSLAVNFEKLCDDAKHRNDETP
ncbi:uncharacterized protein PRCAT00003369001 [Priceomyces carsonii]|uniref:uncharacterized protein n=1 Tax=Priceomyces carsonii TaxID=28549 RepID=UPI002EDA52A9|nr:unnamed protein product [Priceomyces carsonii]